MIVGTFIPGLYPNEGRIAFPNGHHVFIACQWDRWAGVLTGDWRIVYTCCDRPVPR